MKFLLCIRKRVLFVSPIEGKSQIVEDEILREFVDDFIPTRDFLRDFEEKRYSSVQSGGNLLITKNEVLSFSKFED